MSKEFNGNSLGKRKRLVGDNSTFIPPSQHSRQGTWEKIPKTTAIKRMIKAVDDTAFSGREKAWVRKHLPGKNMYQLPAGTFSRYKLTPNPQVFVFSRHSTCLF